MFENLWFHHRGTKFGMLRTNQTDGQTDRQTQTNQSITPTNQSISQSNRKLVISELHFDTRLKIYGSTIGVRNLVCYVSIRRKFPDGNFASRGRPKAKCSAWLEVLKSYDAWATRRLPKAKLRTNQTDGQTDRQTQTSQSFKPTSPSNTSNSTVER